MSNDHICSRLHALIQSLPRHPFPVTENGLPANGIYFLFEDSEPGHGASRIVRIGSHTGAGNLVGRLREHTTDNKDRSIFRKNIGRALLSRDHDPFLADWDLDLTSRREREKNGTRVDLDRQQQIESEVSDYITHRLSFAVIGMPDAETALSFESRSIATVAQCSLCQPTSKWLGKFSPLEKIKESGLWQTQHLAGEVLTDEDLRALERYANGDRKVSRPDTKAQPEIRESASKEHDGIELNDLLRSRNFDPQSVMVFRHRPYEPRFKKVLPWLALEQPELFNAYQQAQGPTVENAMLKAKYVVSFIGHEPGKAVFVGLYSIRGSRPVTLEQFWQMPANQKLKEFGMKGFTSDDGRNTALWFDLKLEPDFSTWKGRLIVDWPGLERSWWRWSDRNSMAVRAIFEESLFEEGMPDWDRLSLNWQDLETMPSRWKTALSHWRGIYYIFDTSEQKGYVGSAYGEHNLLGRWLNYSETGHGGNALLRKRDAKNFLFTILQRVSPDMLPEDVIRLESSWKERLHTRPPYGLNDN